jgi:purine-nucleoside phosphorylase
MNAEVKLGHEALLESLRVLGAGEARVAIVLGSGLGPLADAVDNARSVPYDEIAGMPSSAVPGHEGRLVFGELGGVPVVLQQGRCHLYEGWTAEEASRCVRCLAELGVDAILLTNAAGGLRPEWEIPSLMRLTDHMNLQRVTPLALHERGRGTPYDSELGALIDGAAEEVGVELHKGVYAALPGPTYETHAEVRMHARFGADALGMSTAQEALAAHAAGARVAAISCITNMAAGLSDSEPNHEEVVEAGRQAGQDFAKLITAVVERIGSLGVEGSKK